MNFSFEQVVLKLECTPCSSFVLLQDCPSRQEIQGSLKQVQKLLSAHEASYLQSLRNLKKKLNLLQSNAGKLPTRATNSKQNHQKNGKISAILLFFFFLSPSTFPTGTCPKLDAPANGRKLGKSHSVGHEVHFLCDPGYELVGSESRFCQESLAWSGQQTSCRGERHWSTWPHRSGHSRHCLLLLLFFPPVSLRFSNLTLLSNPLITFYNRVIVLFVTSPCSLLFLCFMHVTNVLSM